MITEDRKNIIKKIVKNYYPQYYSQVKLNLPTITLEDYLKGIKRSSPTMTDEEVEFGLEYAKGVEYND
jgi:hypothetical protein